MTWTSEEKEGLKVDIALISLKYALDMIGTVYTTKQVAVDPALSIDENFYNTMVMDETIITQANLEAGIEYSEQVVDMKPTLAELIARKNEYEEQLKEARRQELIGICRGREMQAMYSTGVVYTKAQSLFNSYVNTDNEEEIVKLVAIIDKIESDEEEANLINTGAKLNDVCMKTINFIAGMNMSKGFTIAQIDEVQTVYSGIEAALRSGRPDKALALLSTTVADGVLITIEDKDKVIAFMTKKLTEQE